MDQRGADASDLVGTHRRADAAAADRHSPIHVRRENGLGEWNHEVRIVVVDLQGMRAEVDDLVPRAAELGDQLLLQGEPAVIGRDAYAHDRHYPRPSRFMAAATPSASLKIADPA